MIELSTRRLRKMPEVQIAPLLDMVLTLLIFVIATTSFIRETGIEVTRPRAITAEEIKHPDLLVTVTAAGTIHMEGRQVSLGTVRSIAKQFFESHSTANVVVIADINARTGLVVDVMDECKLAGAKKISISARVEK